MIRTGWRGGTRSPMDCGVAAWRVSCEAYGEPHVPPAMRDTVLTVIRQRLSAHEHPDAVADALSAVPRSRPFGEVGELAEIDVPVTVVASGDEIDPGHPQEIGERYAATIPDATLVLDEPGRSPVAWQGSQLSRVIADLAARGIGDNLSP